MNLTALGCSGGIGSGRHTTCYLVDDDVLIDAGTGLTTLTLEQLEKIDHVFLTHAHLDHILGLPLLLDAVGDVRAMPLVVHALPEVLGVLEKHIFNWAIWPDFREIPSVDAPWVRFEPLDWGGSCEVAGRRFSPLPVDHVVPACALRVACASGSFVFSGDTTTSPELIAALNAIPDLRHLVIETSFENALADIARASKHHWPDSLAADLAGLAGEAAIWITHLKPGNEDGIMTELRARLGERVQAIRQEQVLTV